MGSPVQQFGSGMAEREEEIEPFVSVGVKQKYFRLAVVFLCSGASIKDVRKKFGFFTLSPHCPQIHATSLTKVAYYVCF